MQKKGRKVKNIIALILVVIMLGGLIASLGWATKGFKDKTFGNLNKIIKDKMPNNDKTKNGQGKNTEKEKEKPKPKEERMKLANGIEVYDQHGLIDRYATTSKRMVYSSYRSENEQKSVYYRFLQYPKKAANRLTAKLVWKSNGQETDPNGNLASSYIGLSATEFADNEALGVKFLKTFDDYIELVVTSGEKEIRSTLGCRGDDIDFSQMDKFESVFSLEDGDKPVEYKLDKINEFIKSQGKSCGTEDKITSKNIQSVLKSTVQMNDIKSLRKMLLKPKNKKLLEMFGYNGVFSEVILATQGAVSEFSDDKSFKRYTGGNFDNGYFERKTGYDVVRNGSDRDLVYILKKYYQEFYGRAFTDEEIKKILTINFYVGLYDYNSEDYQKGIQKIKKEVLNNENDANAPVFLIKFETTIEYKSQKFNIATEPQEMKNHKKELWHFSGTKDGRPIPNTTIFNG